jgi:hypothetical protein
VGAEKPAEEAVTGASAERGLLGELPVDRLPDGEGVGKGLSAAIGEGIEESQPCGGGYGSVGPSMKIPETLRLLELARGHRQVDLPFQAGSFGEEIELSLVRRRSMHLHCFADKSGILGGDRARLETRERDLPRRLAHLQRSSAGISTQLDGALTSQRSSSPSSSDAPSARAMAS